MHPLPSRKYLGLIAVASFLSAAAFGCKGKGKASSDETPPAKTRTSVAPAAAKTERVTSGARAGVFVVGEPAPELALPRVKDFKPLSLARFRGKKTLLLVFASW